MTVENEAFIDIEMALHRRIKSDWNKHWLELQKEITKLAMSGDWEAAHRLTNSINFEPIVSKHEQLARTMAEAALFLGASRFGSPRQSSFFGNPDENLINIAVEQWKTVMVKNANQALRLQAQIILGDMERAQSERDLIKAPANPLSAVGIQGEQFSGIAASLMISRASTAGFFAEAAARGVQVYRVSEVLDSVTCPICRIMHGQEFPIAAGVAQSMSVMQSTDPDSLRQISPWPSQSAASVKKVSLMSQGNLIGAGLNLPPYHPWCRGIATVVTKGGAGQAATIAIGTRLLTGRDGPVVGAEGLTQEELGNRLFGNIDALQEAEFASLFGPGGFVEGVEAGIVDEFTGEQ